jgi:hypothetical protein
MMYQNEESFRPDSSIPAVCRDCFTEKEVVEYARPEISKAMDGCTVNEKKWVIRALIRDYKKRRG